MARRIGFFPIMVASFALTVAFTGPFRARAADAEAVRPATSVDTIAPVARDPEPRDIVSAAMSGAPVDPRGR